MGLYRARTAAMSGNGALRRGGGMRWWVLLLFAGYLGFYYLSHSQPAAFTGRKQVLDLSMAQEVALGVQSYQQILDQADVVEDPGVVAPVRQIAERLIAVAPEVEKIMAAARGVGALTEWDAFSWQLQVIESEQVNAFCLPGGKIAVYTGLLPVAGNADALAAVIGHEIAHALLRHGAERMSQQKLLQIGSLAAGLSTSDMDPRQRQMVLAAIGAGAKFGIQLPFSREHESEADYLGLMLTAGACYDPKAAIGLWQRMGAGGGQRPPEFASTHPSSETRIRQLQGYMAEAEAMRGRFCR